MPVPYGGEILLNLNGLQFKNLGTRIVVITPTFSLLVRAGLVSYRLVLVTRRSIRAGCTCPRCGTALRELGGYFNAMTIGFGRSTSGPESVVYATTKRYSVTTFDTPEAERFTVREAPEIAHSNMPTDNPVNDGGVHDSFWRTMNSTPERERRIAQREANLRPEPSASEVAAINGLEWQLAPPRSLSEAYARTYTRPRSVSNPLDSFDYAEFMRAMQSWRAATAIPAPVQEAESEREGGL